MRFFVSYANNSRSVCDEYLELFRSCGLLNAEPGFINWEFNDNSNIASRICDEMANRSCLVFFLDDTWDTQQIPLPCSSILSEEIVEPVSSWFNVFKTLCSDRKLSGKASSLNDVWIHEDVSSLKNGVKPFVHYHAPGRIKCGQLNKTRILPFQSRSIAVLVYGNILWGDLSEASRKTYVDMLEDGESRFGDVKQDFISMVSSWYYELVVDFSDIERDRLQFVVDLCNPKSGLKNIQAE